MQMVAGVMHVQLVDGRTCVVDEKIKLADVGDQSSIGMELMGLCSNRDHLGTSTLAAPYLLMHAIAFCLGDKHRRRAATESPNTPSLSGLVSSRFLIVEISCFSTSSIEDLNLFFDFR